MPAILDDLVMTGSVMMNHLATDNHLNHLGMAGTRSLCCHKSLIMVFYGSASVHLSFVKIVRLLVSFYYGYDRTVYTTSRVFVSLRA